MRRRPKVAVGTPRIHYHTNVNPVLFSHKEHADNFIWMQCEVQQLPIIEELNKITILTSVTIEDGIPIAKTLAGVIDLTL
jgi:hypothetical protein